MPVKRRDSENTSTKSTTNNNDGRRSLSRSSSLSQNRGRGRNRNRSRKSRNRGRSNLDRGRLNTHVDAKIFTDASNSNREYNYQVKVSTKTPIRSYGELKDAVVVVDRDGFYGITVDIILFNLGLEPAIKVDSFSNWQRFRDQAKVSGQSIILIGADFFESTEELTTAITQLREQSKAAKIVLTTADPKSVTELTSQADVVALKSSRDQEKTLVAVLSELTGIEFNPNGNIDDPEDE